MSKFDSIPELFIDMSNKYKILKILKLKEKNRYILLVSFLDSYVPPGKVRIEWKLKVLDASTYILILKFSLTKNKEYYESCKKPWESSTMGIIDTYNGLITCSGIVLVW